MCLLIGVLTGFIGQARETLETMGSSPANASWWPL
jgi:hypothetical protein